MTSSVAGAASSASHGDDDELPESDDALEPLPDSQRSRDADRDREDPLGVENEEDFDLGGDEDEPNQDAESDDLDIGDVEIRIGEGRKGPSDDAAGIENDGSDEFVPTFADESGKDGDEPTPDDGHDVDDDALPSTADDGGAEGIGDGSESRVDEEALPAMDADAGGDFELNDLLEEMGFGGDEPWEVVPSWSREVALSAVTCRDGTIAATGSAVIILERKAASPRVRALAQPAFGCALIDSGVVLATARGVELIDTASMTAPRVVLERPDVTAVAVAAGQLWVLAGSLLLRVDLTSGSHELVREDALAMTAAQGTLFVASVARGGALERIRGNDGGFEILAVDETTRRFLQRGALIAASTPSLLLLLHEGRALLVRVGGPSVLLGREGIVAGTFRGAVGLGRDESARALLLATSNEGLEMLAADAQGAVHSLLPLGPMPDQSAPLGIAWDSSRELALVTGPMGLIALRPRLKH